MSSILNLLLRQAKTLTFKPESFILSSHASSFSLFCSPLTSLKARLRRLIRLTHTIQQAFFFLRFFLSLTPLSTLSLLSFDIHPIRLITKQSTKETANAFRFLIRNILATNSFAGIKSFIRALRHEKAKINLRAATLNHVASRVATILNRLLGLSNHLRLSRSLTVSNRHGFRASLLNRRSNLTRRQRRTSSSLLTLRQRRINRFTRSRRCKNTRLLRP